MTQDEIKQLEAELKQARAVVSDKENELVAAKMEFALSSLAARGIKPGDKVMLGQKQGIFVGMKLRYQSLTDVMVDIRKIKKDGTAASASVYCYSENELRKCDDHQ